MLAVYGIIVETIFEAIEFPSGQVLSLMLF